MEKYATNLEDVVEERTAQLQVEKKRTDDLLESMLPKLVMVLLKVVISNIKLYLLLYKQGSTGKNRPIFGIRSRSKFLLNAC